LLTLDASYGEGGGQILRTALSLSVTEGVPVALTGIRARRPKPGLQPQHLTVVRALAAISDAEVKGDALDSTQLSFVPRTLRGGSYRFDVGAIKGSAGSVSLLFQSLLLPLASASEPTSLTLIGGTHVPWSPPVHYLTDVFLPALRRIGLEAEIRLRRWGWYPRGGGEIEARIAPARRLSGLRWEERARPEVVTGISAVSNLPMSIAERQRKRALERLAAAEVGADIALVEAAPALGPGTLLFLAATGPSSLAGFSALGRPGLRAEAVADQAVEPLLAFSASGAAVDDHLADQLMPFLSLAGEPSAYTCPTLSTHLTTVAWAVQRFLPVGIELEAGPPARVRVAPPPAR
jgi:RNA 3'-terminal phosphate cyclase (ATP)